MKVLGYGPAAVLLECESPAEVPVLAARLRAEEVPGVREVVPGARTVLVEGPGAIEAARRAGAWPLVPEPAGAARHVTLEVS